MSALYLAMHVLQSVHTVTLALTTLYIYNDVHRITNAYAYAIRSL